MLADRLSVYTSMIDSGLVPLFHHPDADTAIAVARAVVAGGARVFEFTNRGENSLEVFTALARAELPAILGVGSVVDAPTAALYIAAGAQFVVSPVLSAEVARLCNRRKIACIPGCGTVSEIGQAEELGAEIVKIFPASVGGPEFIKAVRGPMPWSRLMPTGGVGESSLAEWFAAGACCVGMGSQLIGASAVAAGRYDDLTERVARVLASIAACR